jgi:hypothetical protein
MTPNKLPPLPERLIGACRMLIDSAPAHMTPRNAKEREAYKLIRSILKELP